jgi:hypothetical protein
MLNKKNQTVKVKELRAYLVDYEDKVVKEIYLEVLENFEDDELVPDLILENLGLTPEFFKDN